MYEEIHIKRRIDWKSAFIKLGVFFLVVIILCLIIFNPTKNTYAENDYNLNLASFSEAAQRYFIDGKLPSEIGNESTVKLTTLMKSKKLKHIDLESEACNKEQSYSKITKIDDNEYSVYTYLECKSNQLSKIDTIRK